MDIKDARCTNCGASLKVEPQKTITECDYCHSTIMVSNAVELALVEVDKTKDIQRYRSLLSDAIQKNSVGEILRLASLIKDLIPSDFSANYYFAYAKQALNEPSFMMAFLKSTIPATPEDIQIIVSHLIQRSDLRDKPAIISFLSRISPDAIERYEAAHKSRSRQEDQYANVMRDVFICHSSHDKDIAEAIVNTLEKEGFTCWISTRNLRPEDSENYWNNIEKAIENTRLFLTVSSESAMLSKDVQREIEISQKNQQKRFEYKIDTVPQTVFFKHVFDGIKWVDGSNDPHKSIHKLPARVLDEMNTVATNPKDSYARVHKKTFNFRKILIPFIFIFALSTTTVTLAIFGVFTTPTYSISFEDFDGSEIETILVEEDEKINFPDHPTREGYTFIGWSSNSSIASEDLVIKAEYQLNQYSVIFEDFDGTRINVFTVNHGAELPLPSNPSREGYLFTGWSNTTDIVNRNLTLTAQYDRLSFRVTFLNHLGDVIKTDTVFYGENAEAPSYTREGYELEGWSQSLNIITEDLILSPIFLKSIFTITFEDYDGSIINTITIQKGNNLEEFPNDPSRDGYTFTGWSSNPQTITEDLTITAEYKINVYIVIFKDHDETILNTISLQHGEKINTYPNVPPREGYTLTGWSVSPGGVREDGAIIDDITLTAQYSIKSYTVTFKDYNGMTIGTQIVDYGSNLMNVINISDPVRENYDFIGWDLTTFQTMPNKDIEIYAFYIVNGLRYTIKDNEATITSYNGHLNTVEIPSKIKNHPVTTISDSAFSSKQLIEVKIPDSVTSIGNSAFSSNQLIELNIPSNVIEIGEWAFSNNQLDEVIIPNSVTKIGDFAFSNNLIKNVTISNNITELGRSVFSNNQLTIVEIPESVISIGYASFAHNLLTNLTIPNSLTFISDYAFYSNQLREVTIPDTVISIGDAAFAENQLAEITIPNGVTFIGYAAFAQNQLTEVTIPSSVTTISVYSFARNQLSSVTIPESVKSIGSTAFAENLLTSLTIPDGLVSIGDGAFTKNQLSSITIPESVTSLGFLAFADNPITNVIILGNAKRFNEVWTSIGFPIELMPE